MFTAEQLEQLAKVIDTRLEAKLKPIHDKLDKQGKDIKSRKKNVDVLIKATNRDDM